MGGSELDLALHKGVTVQPVRPEQGLQTSQQSSLPHCGMQARSLFIGDRHLILSNGGLWVSSLFFYWKRGLTIMCWPGTHCVALDGLKLTSSCLSFKNAQMAGALHLVEKRMLKQLGGKHVPIVSRWFCTFAITSKPNEFIRERQRGSYPSPSSSSEGRERT